MVAMVTSLFSEKQLFTSISEMNRHMVLLNYLFSSLSITQARNQEFFLAASSFLSFTFNPSLPPKWSDVMIYLKATCISPPLVVKRNNHGWGPLGLMHTGTSYSCHSTPGTSFLPSPLLSSPHWSHNFYSSPLHLFFIQHPEWLSKIFRTFALRWSPTPHSARAARPFSPFWPPFLPLSLSFTLLRPRWLSFIPQNLPLFSPTPWSLYSCLYPAWNIPSIFLWPQFLMPSLSLNVTAISKRSFLATLSSVS